MKQTINKCLTLWLLTLVLAVAALPALTAPAQAAEKTPVNVVFGSTTVKGEKEILYGTTRVYCENVTYTLEKDSYYQAYTTWATGDVRIADKVDDKEVRRINTGFFKKVTGNVTLGKNIRSLDYSVFSGGKLREVTIPEDSNLYRICQYAFRECPNLVRVGVGNTDKLPASLEIIDYYAFYKSPAIKSIDLTRTKVKSIDDCTFTDCTALASVKLPDGLTSIDHSAFKGCTALKALDVPTSVKFIGMDTFSYSGITDLKLRCGAVSPAGQSIARSLLAMPDGAKVYLPKPSSTTEYKNAMQFIYGNGQHTYCGANAKVKVYWLDSNNNTTDPVTEPSAKSSSVVTLSGKDNSGNSVTFNYDYTDADGDGLGAVIHLSGRQSDATLKLTLNGSSSYTSNTSSVIFTRVRAYDARHQGNIDSTAYSGKKLTELLLRQQAVNYSSGSSNMSQEKSLALSSTDKLGLYYYIPTLVNEGSTSKPMSAKTLPPVLVVYTPTNETNEGVELEAGFSGSSKWFCGNSDKVDFSETGLSRTYPLYADGFEACFGTESGALTKGKAAYFDNGKNSITYQWNRVNKDGTEVLRTISASDYDYSKAGQRMDDGNAAATFNCYESVRPRGLQYCIGGLSADYLKKLYRNGFDTGIYYFQPTITVTVNGKVTNSVTGPIQSVTFYNELTRLDYRMRVIYADSGTGNVTGPAAATNAPYDDIRQYTMKKGTINAYADIDPFTNLWGLKYKDYDGTIVYDWYYENNASGSTKVYFKDAGPNLPLDQLAKEKPGTYTVFCNVSVRNSKGETVLKSNSGTSGFYCWVKVTSTAANYPTGMPRFDNFPKAIYFDLSYRAGTFKIPAPGTNMFAGSFSTRKLELFEVDSRDQNRGGVLRISGTVKADNDGEFARISGINIPNVEDGYTCVFPNFKARWCYYKYTLTDSAGNTYVVYSPTVAVQPSLLNPQASGRYAVCGSAAMPKKVEVKVTGQPHSEYWLPDSRDVTLTAELETKNYPLIYRTSLISTIFCWHSVDADIDLTENANFTQSARIDSVDIDADGNLLLKGALTATFKRGSGSSDDYFDTTLPLTGNPTVSAPDRRFDLRGRKLVSVSKETTPITWIPSSFADPLINTVTIHPNAVSVITPTVTVTGGRMVPVWNSDTGKYEWGEAPAGEFAENEYRLFSERFDGKTEGQYSNIPASPEAVKITATGYNGFIRWEVTVTDKDGNTFTQSLRYDGGNAITYDEGEGYADQATAVWSNNNRTSTLTVAVPTGTEVKKLTVQPMAVATDGNQVVGLTYGTPCEVYTNRAAKATAPTISHVYGSSAPTYKIAQNQLGAAEDGFVFASPNIWVGTGGRGDTTYRWYLSRVEDERSVDIGTAIPLSEEMTVSGAERDYSVLSLTAQLLRQHCAKIGDSYSDNLYIYAYAQNYDPTATKVQYAEKLMKVCKVEVGNFYAMPAVPITTAYDGASTLDIYYGQKAPEEMFSITIPLPADKTRNYVRLYTTAKSPDGTKARSDNAYMTIIRDDSPTSNTTYENYTKQGNYYYRVNTGMTLSINQSGNTATFTAEQDKYPGLNKDSFYDNGSYESANMDFEFYWYVQGEYFGDANTATGGDRTETTGTKYTVHRRQYPMSVPNLSFYTGTEANYSGTAEKPIPGAENTYFWGSETYKPKLPGFRQHSTDYGYDTNGLRPVTVEVGHSKAPWVLVRMEYWDEKDKGWENLNYSSMVSVPDNTREHTVNGTTYKLVQPGSTVSMLTGPGAYFSGGSDPRFLRIAAYPLGADDFAEGSDALTSITPITPIKEIFVVQPLTGEVVHAEKPACSNKSSFDEFTFSQRDGSVTEHTFGADAWSVSDGGTLSYQWMFYNDKTAEYENITGATGPTLTVTKAQAKAWCEDNGENYTSLQLVVTNTNTKPEITGNRYVTDERSTTVRYGDSAVMPRVSITSSGNTTFNLGEQGGTLTGTVANPAGELTNPSYAWGCRVTHAVANDGTPYTAPADTAFRYPHPDDVAGADTKTLKLYAINGGWNYEIDDSLYSLTGRNSLWASYKEITIEYQLSVTENYTPTGGSTTTSATGTSNIIPVTIKRPVQSTALTVTQNGTPVSSSYVLQDDAPLTFTAPAATGSAQRSYVWAHGYTDGSGYSAISCTDRTFELTKDGHWSYAPYILCVMTDTYADPNSGKTLDLETESNRILVQYMGVEAANPLFTAGSQTVVADPGDTGKTFDGTATSTDLGKITYSWEMVDRVTGETKTLTETSAKLNLDPYTKAGTKSGAWYFTCTATNTRTDGKSASASRSYELYIRGVMLKAELTELDAVAGESSEVRLTATAFGLDDGSFAWTKTGISSEWTLKDAAPGTVDGNFADYTAAAVVTPKTGSAATLNTAVLFSCTPAGETTEKKTAISLTANVKAFAVVDNAIELTVGEAVPAGIKLAYKGATPDTWTVENDDGLTAAGVTVAADGTLSGTPTVPGPYRMTVKATNGTTTATGIVTVYVKISERAELSEDGVLTVNKKLFAVSGDASGSGWNWDTHTGVLTLNNYNSGRLEASGFGTAPLYIRLRGSSTVTAADYSAIIGTYQKGTVLCGSGNLTVNGTGNVVTDALDVRGSGKIKVNGTGAGCKGIHGDLTVNGGTLDITVTGQNSCGIDVSYSRSITIPAGTVTVTAKGAGSMGMDATKCGSFQVSGSGKLTVDVEGASSYNSTAYAVNAPHTTIHVSDGGTFNITGKQMNFGVCNAKLDVDGGTLNIDLTRTGDNRDVCGVTYYNTIHSVKNKGKLNINIESDGGGYVVGIDDEALEVDATSTATITAKSGGVAKAVELKRIKCDGNVTLTAESGKETATACGGYSLAVEGKGTLTATAKSGRYAQPFSMVTLNGTDEAAPLTVHTLAKAIAKDGIAYLNGSTVETKGNVNITMEVESVSGGEAHGIGGPLKVGHTAGSITLRTVKGTTLENKLAGEVNYEPANFAVTGNPNGKDFVTYTATSADAPLISNTSGGAVTLYQNTELSTDELTFTVKGGTAPYTWALTSGTLPASMRLSETTGAQVKITGTPTATGTFPVTLTVTDKNGKKASAAVTITVKTADLVLKEKSLTGLFQGDTLYLSSGYVWKAESYRNEYVWIDSIGGDVSKLEVSTTGVLNNASADLRNKEIYLGVQESSGIPKAGDKGTFTVKLLNAAGTQIASYTYNYVFLKDNPCYLYVGGEKFPAMLGNANGEGWSWDRDKSTLTLDNYKCDTRAYYLVSTDVQYGGFSGLTVIYKGNVEAKQVQYFSDGFLPGMTYKAYDENATLTLRQYDTSGRPWYSLPGDVTFEGGNVALYPLRGLVESGKTAKITVKDAAQFLVSDEQMEEEQTIGSDAIQRKYTKNYWLYKAADDRVMSCGTVAPTPEFSITGPDKVTKTGSVVLKAEFAPWFTESEKYDQTNKPLGKAFKLHYAWPPEYTDQDVASVSVTAGTMPIGGSKTVSCEVWTEFNGLTSGRVSDTHTVTVVADGVKVSGQVRSYNPGNSLYVTLYKADTTDVVNVNHVGSFSGSGQVTQPFSFKSVPKGTYDLVVTKEAHLTYTVKNVVVGDTDLDLTKLTDKPYQTITLLAGDVNGDGSINESDVSVIRQAGNINKAASAASNPKTDVNGDGSINESDVSVVRQAVHINKGTGDCTHNFKED